MCSSVFGFFDVFVGLFPESHNPLDFFCFSRHVLGSFETERLICVNIWRGHRFVFSILSSGSLLKRNLVVKWLCSLDFLNCHDARWNALLDLCWLMCDVRMTGRVLRKYTKKRMFDRHFAAQFVPALNLFLCGSSTQEGARVYINHLKPDVLLLLL